MRHQADGRYGSEVREANQAVRKQARYYEEVAKDAKEQLALERDRADKRIKREQDRADEKDKLIGELVTELMLSSASCRRSGAIDATI